MKEHTISKFQTETLKQVGWVTETIPDLRDMEEYLLQIGMALGQPKRLRDWGEIVQKLTPTLEHNAHPKSLSALHSLLNFPIHIDTAHWLSPCRYVILGCSKVGSGNRKTKLLDFGLLAISKDEKKLLCSTPFKVVNGCHSFYSNVLSHHRDFIRYDRGCMVPTSSSGFEVFEIFSEERWKNQIEEIEWQVGTVLIIDNWRVLHGRGVALKEDSDRLLHRVLVV